MGLETGNLKLDRACIIDPAKELAALAVQERNLFITPEEAVQRRAEILKTKGEPPEMKLSETIPVGLPVDKNVIVRSVDDARGRVCLKTTRKKQLMSPLMQDEIFEIGSHIFFVQSVYGHHAWLMLIGERNPPKKVSAWRRWLRRLIRPVLKWIKRTK